MTDDQKSPERTVRPAKPAEGGRPRGDESLADEKGAAQGDADTEDPTMGGTSDGDTSA